MTLISNPDITKALDRIRCRAAAYEKAEKYYDGCHNLAYATEKFENAFGKLFREFAMNLCPAVVDAVKDKLVVSEFSIESGETSIADEAWKIWQANRMGIRAGEIHKEAAKTGDAYAIVWPNAEGKVTIYPNRAANCTVFYDDENPGRILWAAKLWQRDDDKRWRLNLFYPDRVERYLTKAAAKPAVSTDPKKDLSVIPFAAAEFESMEEKPITNPYGIVPVFHFANNGEIGRFGTSELKSAIPVQDALNKSVLDMMVTMEFSAYRQRWAAGIEIEYDDDGKPKAPFEAGISHLWITEHPDAKFGDFEASDLEKFIKVKESFRTDLSMVTGTPAHYLMQTGAAFPQSGISVEKLESRFLNKIRDRQNSFGAVWEDVMSFALTIENKGTGVRLFTGWEDPAPLSENEQLINLGLKKDIGVTDEYLLMEAGYGEADIKKMMAAKEAERERMVQSFNAGDLDPES
jgi:hypothetical protein